MKLWLLILKIIILICLVSSLSVPSALANPSTPLQEGLKYYREGTRKSILKAINTWSNLLTTNDIQTKATVLNFLGLAHADIGDINQAISYYQQVLPLADINQDSQQKASVLMSIARVYRTTGEYQKALDTYEESLMLWQKVNYNTGAAATLNNIGLLYRELGDNPEALSYYNRALSLTKKLNNPNNIAATLNNIAQIYTDQGNYQSAKKLYQEALTIWEKNNQLKGQASTLNNIAYIEQAQNQPKPALALYSKALKIWQKIGDRNGESSTLNNMGIVTASTKDHKSALEYYNKALAIRTDIHDKTKQALSLYYIATSLKELGNLDEAKNQIETALTIIEELRTKVNASDLRATFLGSKQDYYKLYIEILMLLHKTRPNQGFDQLAFEASERSRARSLLDLLSDSQTKITNGIDPQLLQQQQALNQKLSAAEERRVKLYNTNHTEEQKQAIEQEIAQLLQQDRDLKAQIKSKNPHYAELTQSLPLTLQEIQQQVLDSHTVLLSYSLGKERSYLWLVSSNSITTYELPKEDEIENIAKKFRTSITSPAQRNRFNIWSKNAQTLSKIIIDPVANKIKNKRLIILPDGGLQYIPMGSIAIGNKTNYIPLITEHEIITLPSGSTLGIIRSQTNISKPPNKTIAILADPIFSKNDDRLPQGILIASRLVPPEVSRSARAAGIEWDRLPFTQQEAQKILSLVPDKNQTTSAIGFEANRNFATSSQLNNYKWIHFATHGFVDSNQPQLSGLVLSLIDQKGNSQNGFLRLYDIYNLNLPVELVVLSACQTGLGKDIKGEGLIGMTRGFMYAGAKRVLVSLWRVDDQATSEFMVKFYQELIQQKTTPAAALRTAMIKMYQNEKWQSPYFWAAFTLQGEYS